MNRLMILFISFVFSTSLSGQEIIKVETNADLNKQFESQKYLYPDFQNGRVLYKDNSIAGGTLNYNILTKKIELLNEGMLFEAENQNNILLVIIGKNTLIKIPKGFGEVLTQAGKYQLIMLSNLEVKAAQADVGYGKRSETTATDNITYSHHHTGYGGNNSINNKEVTVNNSTEYYLRDGNKSHLANKKGFLKVFSKNKKDIEEYIKENKINFSDEDSLKQLFNYCVNL